MSVNKLEIFRESLKRNYFLLLLTLVVGLVGILPLILKPTSPYYSIDPDPAYVANGLEYLQIHKIFMTDHPGTPLVVYLSAVFLPVKVFVKLMGGVPFAEWAVENFSLFMWTARYSVFAVFLTGIYIFQLTFYKLYKSYLVNLFLSAVLFLIPYFFGFQGVVTPENFGLFFTSLWFYFIAKYIKGEKIDLLVIASVFSGLAVSSKMTFIFVFAATLLISFYKKSVRKSLLIVGGFITGFFFGILPILKEHDSLYKLFLYLFTRESVFAATHIVGTNWFGGNYIFLILIAVFAFLIIRKREMKVLMVIFLSAFVGLFVFAKYSSLHYQFANFLLLVLCLTMLFAELRKKEMTIVLIFLAFFLIRQIPADFQTKRSEVASSANLQKYVSLLPANGFYIWDIVGSKEYSLIRGKEWSNWFYASELKKYRPNLWYLYPVNLGVIINSDGQRYSIDDFCWDGLFLSSDNLENFLSSQKIRENYKEAEIPGTKVLFVTQLKCSKIPHPQTLNI